MEGDNNTFLRPCSPPGSSVPTVGMVKLSVEGDAMVGLYVDGEKLEAMDGHLYVDLGTEQA